MGAITDLGHSESGIYLSCPGGNQGKARLFLAVKAICTTRRSLFPKGEGEDVSLASGYDRSQCNGLCGKGFFEVGSAGVFESAPEQQTSCLPDSRGFFEQLEGRRAALLHLIVGALFGTFIRTPTNKTCTVTKSAAGEMIEGDFHDKFWIEWFPFA
jgi:hypothetical protein